MLARRESSGWRGVALVAVTYVYFLIFAQFAFLSRLGELNLAASGLNLIMGAMAAGGILLSLITPRLGFIPSPVRRLRIAFVAGAFAALASLLPLDLNGAVSDAFLIGAALGLLTVTLVTHLRSWTGNRNAILKVGVGTGIGYFLCNVPALFTAIPQVQAIAAAALCLIGAGLVPSTREETPGPAVQAPPARFTFVRAVASFAALVWLDSAAFFIIQHTPELKAGTWMGSLHLWTNAVLHLGAALVAGWFLQRHRSGGVLSAALFALGFACLLLHDSSLALPASLFYPVGVSLYSVALVAYPSFLTAATVRVRGVQAGWIYAIAGWIGSALGIGMGRNLGHVPAGFVAVAGVVVLSPELTKLARSRTRELAFFAIALAVAFALYRLLPSHSEPTELSAVERGRRVYISEGCIHCHSQYVRPNSPDELMWGPASSLQPTRSQQPPLIGDRRQGPDLAQVGARRSPLWLKAHLLDPRQVVEDSVMPSYAFLFHAQRGDDLVAYLASLRNGDTQRQLARQQAWQLAPSALAHADAEEGERLYEHQCAACHNAQGRIRLQYQSEMREAPANLSAGPFHYLKPASDLDRRSQLSRMAKFGIPGTDMPGHEYLSDQQIASLALFLTQSTDHSVHHE
jgi:cbb3-type cytochrome oxidase cytochrome c subunit